MKKTLCFMILTMAALVSFAETYYVSPAGDDANPGTSLEKPWLTLNRSFSALRSGDTLVIGEGNYQEAEFSINGVPGKDEDLSKPVVIRAERLHAAIIHGDVPLEGFKKLPGYRSVYACIPENNILAVVEADTDIVYQQVPSLVEAEECIASYYYDNYAKVLYVHTTDGSAPARHALKGIVKQVGGVYRGLAQGEKSARTIIMEGLVFRGFNSMALSLFGAHNLTVRNCVFFHNCYGIYLADLSRNVRVEDCLFFSNNITKTGSPEQAPIVVCGNVADIVVDGNISRHNRFNSIRAYCQTILPGSTVVFSNNRSYGEAPFWFKGNNAYSKMTGNVAEGSATAEFCAHNTFPAFIHPPNAGEGNLLFGNGKESKEAARFVDPINGDYRLQSDSPFRGKGPNGSDLGAFPYQGDVFFVRPDGNDAAEGTSVASAWKNPARIVQRLKPGDTLYLMAGTYAGPLRITQKANAQKPICLKRRGHDAVVIQGPGPGLDLNGARNIRIEGLEIRNISGAGIRAENCAGLQIEECLLHDNKTGIELGESGGITLKHNTIARNGRGLVARSSSGLVQHAFRMIEERTARVNQPAAAGALELISNILQDNYQGQLVLEDEEAVKNYYGNYNCFAGSGPEVLAEICGKRITLKTPEEFITAVGERQDSIYADALFANPASGDFRLKVGSPCRGRGEFERTIGRNDLVPVVPEKLEIDDVRLHYVGGDNITITYWTPKQPSYAVVEYGVGNATLGRVDLPLERRIFHVVNLVGLKTNTTYWFRPGARYHSESWIDFTRRARGQDGVGPADTEGFAERGSFTTLKDNPAGRNLYVRQDGEDYRDGLTPATAWKTLRQAALNARAGDIVLVGPGRYYETLAPYNSGISASGRITFRSEKPREAILDGKDFSLPYAFKVIGKNYISLDGFRIQYQKSIDYDMTGVAPWSAQVLLSQARFCEIRNCYLYGGAEFPSDFWTAIMGIRINQAEGAVIDDNFLFLQTWAAWDTTSYAKPQSNYIAPLFKNNTFFIQQIHTFLIIGENETIKLRNNLFGEHIRFKRDIPCFTMWYPWAIKLDSDYNFFWWHNDKQGKPEYCTVGNWYVAGKQERTGNPPPLPGGLAPWQQTSAQDKHSLEAFFPDNNIYHQLDFTIAGKPYAGKGENGADIGCTWIGRHTDKVIFERGESKVDIPPWKNK